MFTNVSEESTEPFEQVVKRGGAGALARAGEFFMREGSVYHSLRKITAKLEELGIPYAVAGGMALVAHGYERTTVDVDLLVTAAGLAAVHQQLSGLGYLPPFKNSKHLRDTETGVRIEFLVAGQFPGDGKPKPVAFPDPAAASILIEGIRFLKVPALVELKLASGITNPGRVKDLGDVQELIRVLNLPRSFSDQIDPFVRAKFDELWLGAQQSELPD